MKVFNIAALAFALVGSSTGLMAAEHVIEMKNSGEDGTLIFEPGFVQAEVGDTVVFKATDPSHNSASALVPDGAESWDGDINEEIEITLDAEGVYVYVCTPHAMLNMAGIIQVGEPVNLDAASETVAELTASAVANEDRLEAYLAQVSE